jgi:hypothetical protein
MSAYQDKDKDKDKGKYRGRDREMTADRSRMWHAFVTVRTG